MPEDIITYRIDNISVADIIFPANELRTKVFFEDLDELARSIKTVGLLNPLTVRKSGDKFELIAGFRRLKACEICGIVSIPCRVLQSDDTTADMQKIHENLFREEVNPVDEGNFFKRLLVKNNWRIIDLAAQIHKSPSYVSKRVQLLDADPLVMQALSDNQVNISIADELGKIDDPATRQRLLHICITSGATVETVRSWRVQYEIEKATYQLPGQNGIAPGLPDIQAITEKSTLLTDDTGPDRKIQEQVLETRTCYSCLSKVDAKTVHVMFFCEDCKRILEQALKQPAELTVVK